MSEIKALEKLRGELQICRNAKTRPTIAFVEDCIDEIEAEINERFMPCPCDAEGVPIRIGDTVREVDDRVPMKVMSLTFYDDCVDVNACGMNPNLLRHVKPRTLEDVLEDFAEAIEERGTEWVDVSQTANVIRELMKDDAHADSLRRMKEKNDD